MRPRKKKPSEAWKLVTEYDVTSYRRGLRAGDRVGLVRPLKVEDHTGRPIGLVYPTGELWDVLRGPASDPGVVWLRQPDGKPHTSDDTEAIHQWFRRVAPADDSGMPDRDMEENGPQ